MLISGFESFVMWVFCSVFMFPLCIFAECDGCVFSVLLACSAGVFTGMPDGVRGWESGMNLGKEDWGEGLRNLLVAGSEKKVRSQ